MVLGVAGLVSWLVWIFWFGFLAVWFWFGCFGLDFLAALDCLAALDFLAGLGLNFLGLDHWSGGQTVWPWGHPRK